MTQAAAGAVKGGITVADQGLGQGVYLGSFQDSEF